MSFPTDLRDAGLNTSDKYFDMTWTPMKADQTLAMMSAPVTFWWANWAAAWYAWGDMTAKAFNMPAPSDWLGAGANSNAKPAAKAEAKAAAAPVVVDKTMHIDPVVSSAKADDPHVKVTVVEGSFAEARPQGLAEARNGKPDDLKMISGVGPKIEKTLHSLGIFHFDQVANWNKAELEWVDGYLNFKGRAVREDWVAQADALAAGGRDEYVKRFGKEPR